MAWLSALQSDRGVVLRSALLQKTTGLVRQFLMEEMAFTLHQKCREKVPRNVLSHHR